MKIAEKKSQTSAEGMLHAGAHFGYSKARRHPSTKAFVAGVKNRVELLDLDKASLALDTAKAFVADLAFAGKHVLFVGTKPEAERATVEGASAIGMPYVIGRWIGGTLTNFPEIKKRLARALEWAEKKEKGELAIYTKKERLLIDRELERLTKNFGGILSVKEMPAALFVVDPRHEKNAMAEAKAKGIPVIAIASSDCNIKGIAYPVVANDSALPSIKFFVDAIVDAYREGAARPKAKEETTTLAPAGETKSSPEVTPEK